jgi:predicted ATP-dependent endonuclease of OLD family
MFLKRCEIKNFRSIKDLTVNFDNNFQILVGLNESGKSNILRALSFLEPTVIPNADDIRDPRHDEEPINGNRQLNPSHHLPEVQLSVAEVLRQ